MRALEAEMPKGRKERIDRWFAGMAIPVVLGGYYLLHAAFGLVLADPVAYAPSAILPGVLFLLVRAIVLRTDVRCSAASTP